MTSTAQTTGCAAVSAPPTAPATRRVPEPSRAEPHERGGGAGRSGNPGHHTDEEGQGDGRPADVGHHSGARHKRHQQHHRGYQGTPRGNHESRQATPKGHPGRLSAGRPTGWGSQSEKGRGSTYEVDEGVSSVVTEGVVPPVMEACTSRQASAC